MACMRLAAAAGRPGRTASPRGAEVYFHYPLDGIRVPQRFTVQFGLRGLGVAPAGVVKPLPAITIFSSMPIRWILISQSLQIIITSIWVMDKLKWCLRSRPAPIRCNCSWRIMRIFRMCPP